MMIDALQRAALARQLRQDPPRLRLDGTEEARVVVEVECISNGVVACGRTFNAGKNQVDVYESEEAELLSLIEDWTRPGGTPAEMKSAVAREFSDMMREADEVERKVPGAAYTRPYLPSESAAFRAVFKRDRRPFESVKRVEAKKRAS